METKQNKGYTNVPDSMVQVLGMEKAYILSRLIRWKAYLSADVFQVPDSTLMEECLISKSTLKRYQAYLKENGYIMCESKKRKDGSNEPMLYKLNIDKVNEFYGFDIFKSDEEPLTNKITNPNIKKEGEGKAILPTKIMKK